jgi:hypothetical protein
VTLDAASLQSSLAGNLIENVLGRSQQAQTDLAMKLAKVSLAINLQSTAAVNGAGSIVDSIA